MQRTVLRWHENNTVVPGEFDLIDKFFSPHYQLTGLLGGGDDGAVLPAQGALYATQASWRSGAEEEPAATVCEQLIEALRAGFNEQGAAPRWLFLCLTLPSAHEAWPAAFSTHLLARCHRAGMYLVGGDTTRGPLAVDLFCLGVTT